MSKSWLKSVITLQRKELSPIFGGILLSSSIGLSMALPAMAGAENMSRAEFRAQHPELSRQDVRQLYREQFGRQNPGGGGGGNNHGLVVPNQNANPGHNPIVGPGAGPAFNNLLREQREARRLNHRLERHALQDVGGSHLVRVSTGVDLDFTSNAKNIYLGGNLFKNADSVEITVGGEKRILTAGAQVTAAEYVAVKQVLASGEQRVVLDQGGTATGGSVDLSAITGQNDRMRASNLVISSGLTTYGDFSKQSDFRLLGDLTNNGSLYLVSSGNRARGGAVRADDITNQSGATISSAVPEAVASELTGVGKHAANVDLELNARGKLTNLGTLSSSGDLTLVAGGGIENSGVASASDSLNVYTANLVNSNRMEAGSGNINIDAPATVQLDVNNTGGTLAATNGAINIRTESYTGTFNNNITGGDLLSNAVNVHGGNATNNISVNALTGIVNQTGREGHVLASTENLVIGNNCFTGDPTFYNDAGSITINGVVDVAENLTIIAALNIVGSGSLSAHNATKGFDITLIAGANIIAKVGGGNTGGIPPLPGTPGAVTLDGLVYDNGLDKGGGSILFNIGGMTIDTTPTDKDTKGFNGSGGNVYMYAFHSAKYNSGGSINLANPGTSITTSGVGTGSNGDLVMVAGAPTATNTIQFVNINTAGGTGGGGDVSISTAQPVSSGGNIDYAADGSRTSVAQLIAGPTLAAGAKVLAIGGGAITIGGDLSISAGDSILTTIGADPELGVGVFNMQDNSANVTLVAGTGNIGASQNSPLVFAGYNKKFSKGQIKKGNTPGNGQYAFDAQNGSIFIERNTTTTVNLNKSYAKNDFRLVTGGALNINGDVTAENGFLQTLNTGGSLDIASGVKLTANTFMDIANISKGSFKPTYTVGNGAQLITTSTTQGVGQIFVTLASNANKKQKPFKDLPTDDFDANDFPPNMVNLLGKDMTFLPTVNTFTAFRSDVTLDNFKKGAMIFQGGVVITAGQ